MSIFLLCWLLVPPDQAQIAGAMELAYGPEQGQVLDIHYHGIRAEDGSVRPDGKARPTLVFFHGGGWVSGNKDSALPFVLPFRKQGWQLVNVGYRLGENTAPAAAEDAVRAVAWLGEHGSSYGIDPHQLVLMGTSAGGHLALLAGAVHTRPDHPAYAGKSLTIKAVINYFGISHIADVWAALDANQSQWHYPRIWVAGEEQLADISKRYSPTLLFGKQGPPVISIHGDQDNLVPLAQSRALHERLNQLNLPNQLLIQREGGHGRFKQEQWDQIAASVDAFLRHIAKVAQPPQ